MTDFSEQVGYLSDVSALGLQLGFPVSEFGRISPHYNLQYTDIQPFGASASLAIVAGTYSASSVGFTYTYDTRDDYIRPTRGGPGTQPRRGRLGGDSNIFAPLSPASTTSRSFSISWPTLGSSRYLTGYGGQTIPINERFFKVVRRFAASRSRGVGPRATVAEVSIGAQFYAIGTYQVRLPQILPEDYGIALSAFADFGTVGLITGVSKVCIERVQCIKDNLAARVAVGIAINWRSPFGPVEIDVGYPLVQAEYDKAQVIRFSAGTAF